MGNDGISCAHRVACVCCCCGVCIQPQPHFRYGRLCSRVMASEWKLWNAKYRIVVCPNLNVRVIASPSNGEIIIPSLYDQNTNVSRSILLSPLSPRRQNKARHHKRIVSRVLLVNNSTTHTNQKHCTRRPRTTQICFANVRRIEEG